MRRTTKDVRSRAARALVLGALIGGGLAPATVHASPAASGTVLTWGAGANGRLGDGTTAATTAPRIAGSGSGLAARRVASVAAGGKHTLAATSDGRVWGWGDDTSGQVDGSGDVFGATVPTPIDVTPPTAPTGTAFVAIAAGGDFSLALTGTGTVWSWGEPSLGQLGRITTSSSPAPIPGLSDVVAVAAGRSQALALTGEGRVYAWGSNLQGQLGTGFTPATGPTEVPGLDGPASAIAAGDRHSLAVVGGTVVGWGDNSAGQLADAATLGFRSPVPVPAFAGSPTAITSAAYTAVAAGAAHSLALTAAGEVVAFGSASSGELGEPTTTSAARVVAGIPPAVALAAGGGTSGARLADGRLFTWGANASGQLGRGSVGGTSATPAAASAAPIVAADLGDLHAVVAEAPTATLTPSTLSFPVTSPGTTTATRRLTLTNTSGRVPLFVLGASVDDPAFHVTASACTAAPLAPSASCTIEVGFTPSAEQLYGGAVQVLSNAFGGPLGAAVRGTGALPAGAVSIVADSASVAASPASAPASRLLLQPTSPVAIAGGADMGSIGLIGGADMGSIGLIGGGANIGSIGLIGGANIGSIGLIGGANIGSIGLIGGANIGSIGLIPLAQQGLHQVKLSDVPIPGGWADVKRGTQFELLPDQAITLGQLFTLDPQPARLTALTIGELVQAGATHESALTAVPLLSLFTGRTPVSQMPLPTGDPGWCARLEAQGFAGCGAGVSRGAPTATGPVASILELSLAGFDVRLGLGEAGPVPITALPLGTIELAADAPLIQVKPAEVTNLATSDLGSVAVTPAVADCARVACGTTTLHAASLVGAIRPEATLAGLRGSAGFDALRLGEAAFGLLPSATPTGQIPLDRLGLVGTGTTTVGYTVRYAPTGGAGLTRPTVSLDLPAGFTVAAGTTTASIGGTDCGPCAGDPVATGDVLTGATFTWAIGPDVPPGEAMTLSFQARPGLALGRTTIVDAGITDAGSGRRFAIAGPSAPVEVVDPAATSTTPDTAQPLGTDTLGLTWIPSAGTRRIYRIDLPAPAQAPGTALTAALDHLPGVDLDLRGLVPVGQESYEPALRPVSGGIGIPTLGEVKGGLADASVRLDPEADRSTGVPLCATLAADQPCTPLVAVGVGNQRGGEPEVISWVHPGGPGPVFLEVTGFEGASSPSPAALQLSAVSPVAVPGGPRTFPFAVTRTTAPAPRFAAGTTTVALTAWDRLSALHGAAPTAVAADEVRRMIADAGGVELQVDRHPSVAPALLAWDEAPTDPARADDVVRAVGAAIDAAVPGGMGSLQHVLIVGGDDVIPSARLLDPEIDGNERKVAAELASFVSTDSALYAAAALGRMLSDAPYGATTAKALPGRHLYLPTAGVSRLVETPAEIVASSAAARTSAFTLGSTKALVTGYDFLTDSAQRQAGALSGRSQTESLISPPGPPWTRTDLTSRLAVSAPDTTSLSGHADSSRLLPPGATNAAGLFSSQDVLAAADLSRKLVVSVGCHSGQLIGDNDLRVPGDPLGLEFAQAITRKGGTFVGQTGYAFGATASVAYSEDLLARFVELLANLPADLAAVRAITEYVQEQPYLDPYDEKVVQQLSIYGVGLNGWSGRTALPADPAPFATTLDPATGLQSAALTLAPSYTEVTTPEGSIWSPPAVTSVGGRPVVGGTTAAVGRPVQPKLIADVTAGGGLLAKGVVIEGLTEHLRTGWDPALTRPVIDASASEAEPTFGDVLFPATIADVHRVGGRDALAVVPARYRSTGLVGRTQVGDERLYRDVKVRVLYSTDPDTTPAVVTRTSGAIVDGRLVATIIATPPPGGTIAGGTLAVRDSAGAWKVVPLHAAPGIGSGALIGSTPVEGDRAEWFADVISSNGTTVHVASKGDNFLATRLVVPPATGVRASIIGTLAPAGTWYQQAAVRIDGGTDARYSLDGGPLTTYTGPVPITGDGLHELTYSAIDPVSGMQVTGSILVPVDATAPTVSIVHPTTATEVLLRSTQRASYSCGDATAGIVSCSGSVADGGLLDTGTVGTRSLTVTATDAAGHTSAPTVVTYRVVYDFRGFKGIAGPPTVNKVNGGSTVPIRWELYDALGGRITEVSSVTSAGLHLITISESGGVTSSTPTTSDTSGISYDSGSKWFQDNRKFDRSLAGTYQAYVLVLDDGTIHSAWFKVT